MFGRKKDIMQGPSITKQTTRCIRLRRYTYKHEEKIAAVNSEFGIVSYPECCIPCNYHCSITSISKAIDPTCKCKNYESLLQINFNHKKQKSKQISDDISMSLKQLVINKYLQKESQIFKQPCRYGHKQKKKANDRNSSTQPTRKHI